MRVTREMLLKNAEDVVEERIQEDENILAVYLSGSLLDGEPEPLLGGAADIDLVFIYEQEGQDREIIRLSEAVHLDIQHHAKNLYQPPRELRNNPWLGHTLFKCRPMYDPKHFLDFTQAGVRGMFDIYENVIARAEPLLNESRQQWLSFHNQGIHYGPKQVWDYLTALENTANGLASLSGAPLPIRRFMPLFESKVEQLGHPGLSQGFLGLLGCMDVSVELLESWLPRWELAYDEIQLDSRRPIELHKHRKKYYQTSVEYWLQEGKPHYAVWPLLRTWSLAAKHLLPGSAAHIEWQQTFEELTLLGPDFEDRLVGLDAYLDSVEEVFEGWKKETKL